MSQQNDFDVMNRERAKWVKEFAKVGQPAPSLQALAAYHRGFMDARFSSASGESSLTNAVGENMPIEREPLLPKSQFTGRRMFMLPGSLRYHTDHRGNRVVLCGCAGVIRGVNGWSKLGRGRRRDQRWADRYRCYGRLPDRKDRW